MSERDWFWWKGTMAKLNPEDYPEPETVIGYEEGRERKLCRVYGDVKEVTQVRSIEGNFFEVELTDGTRDRLQPKYGRVWVRGKIGD